MEIMSDALKSPEFEGFAPEVIYSPQGEQLAVRFDVLSLLVDKLGPDWQNQGRSSPGGPAR